MAIVRVLHAVAGMDRGGIETFLMNVYRNIDRTKVQFDFLLNTSRECAYNAEIRLLGGRIYSIPSRREGIFKRKRALYAFLREHDEYKVMHQHSSSLTDIVPLQVAKKMNMPIRIIHCHNANQGGSAFHKYIHWINRFFIKKYATDFYACSDLAAKWMYSHKQYKKREFALINYGINLKNFSFDPVARMQLRKEFGFNDRQLIIGNVGRFHTQKNHLFLLEIFAEVLKRRSDAYLCLVGDGELRPQIEKKIRDLKISDNVILMGIRSDIYNILNMIDVFLFPSLYEGFGIVLIEAQAMGIPCIVSTEVPLEVKILDTLICQSLIDNKVDWCNAVIQVANAGRIPHAETLVADAGYNIESVSKKLEVKYLESLGS